MHGNVPRIRGGLLVSSRYSLAEGQRMTSLSKYSLIGVLFLSALVTTLSSGLIPSGGAPDEIHHYSYVQYVANNPLDFPPHHENIYTGDGEPNHLIHPPLYYQLMAIPYKLMAPEEQLTSIARPIDQDGGSLTRDAIIPPLRSASLLLFIAHLVGIYYLLHYLVSRELVKPWLSVLAAACLTLAPAVIAIGGTLNNDVLVLAIWPFLATHVLKFWHAPTQPDLYLLSILSSAAILAKATLWFAAAVVVAVVLFRLAKQRRPSREEACSRFLHCLWSVSKPSNGRHIAGASIAILISTAAVLSLLARLARYGQLQPGYIDVFGLSPEESKFFVGGPPEPLGPLEFSSWAMSLTLRSLYGVLTHDDRIYVQNPDRFFQMVIAITTIALVVAVWRLIQDPSDQAAWIAMSFIVFALLFVLVFLFRAFDGYHRNGRFGAQGRYLFAYYGGWVLAVSILLSRRPRARDSFNQWGPRILSVGYLFCIVALLFIFVRPVFYLNNTTQIHQAAEISDVVHAKAIASGFGRVELQPISPERLVERGQKSGGLLPSPRWFIAWSDSTFRGDISARGCVRIWVYALGNIVWYEPARLQLSLDEGDSIVVNVASNPEVHELILRGSGDLLLEHVNFKADGPLFSERLWPENRVVDLFDVYSQPC